MLDLFNIENLSKKYYCTFFYLYFIRFGLPLNDELIKKAIKQENKNFIYLKPELQNLDICKYALGVDYKLYNYFTDEFKEKLKEEYLEALKLDLEQIEKRKLIKENQERFNFKRSRKVVKKRCKYFYEIQCIDTNEILFKGTMHNYFEKKLHPKLGIVWESVRYSLNRQNTNKILFKKKYIITQYLVDE